MKNFDSRTYSINDFLEWYNNNQLELSPKFQRRSVWSDTGRSYLMDTIVRGKPIPKVFIRQKLNIHTRQSVREVVDGQQRLRTIMSYLKDGFVINKKHHPLYGGLFFSQLGDVDEDIQANILNYEISADLLVNMADSEVLDIFGRLNSYSVILNDQEKINANHFGPFKTLSDTLAHKFNLFWIENKILSESEILRMADTALTSDLIIAMNEGIKTKKSIKSYYDQYERRNDFDVEETERQFTKIINIINDVFGSSLRSSEFRRIHLFYSLFTSFFHLEYGLKDIEKPRKEIQVADYPRIAYNLERVNAIFDTEDIKLLSEIELQFLNDS